MPNIGPAEILVVLVVALLVFGPQKLPEIGRQVGKAARELRRMQASLRDEVRDVLEPVDERAAPPKLPASPAPGSDASDDATTAGEAEGGDEELSPSEDGTRAQADEREGTVDPGPGPSGRDDPSAASDTTG